MDDLHSDKSQYKKYSDGSFIFLILTGSSCEKKKAECKFQQYSIFVRYSMKGLTLFLSDRKQDWKCLFQLQARMKCKKNKGGFLFCLKLSFLIKTFFVIEI